MYSIVRNTGSQWSQAADMDDVKILELDGLSAWRRSAANLDAERLTRFVLAGGESVGDHAVEVAIGVGGEKSGFKVATGDIDGERVGVKYGDGGASSTGVDPRLVAGFTSCIYCAVLNGQAPPLDSLSPRDIPHPYPLQWLSFVTVHTPRPWCLCTLLRVGRTHQCRNAKKKSKIWRWRCVFKLRVDFCETLLYFRRQRRICLLGHCLSVLVLGHFQSPQGWAGRDMTKIEKK